MKTKNKDFFSQLEIAIQDFYKNIAPIFSKREASEWEYPGLCGDDCRVSGLDKTLDQNFDVKAQILEVSKRSIQLRLPKACFDIGQTVELHLNLSWGLKKLQGTVMTQTIIYYGQAGDLSKSHAIYTVQIDKQQAT